MAGMKTGEPISSSFPIRSSAHSLRSEARTAVLPPGERARRSTCPFPRRGTARMLMSFHKIYVCISMSWINIKQNKVIERNISGERSSQNTQLSRERKEGLIVFSPLQFIALPPGTLRGVSVPMISWSGPATAEALRQLRSRGSRMDLADAVFSPRKCIFFLFRVARVLPRQFVHYGHS